MNINANNLGKSNVLVWGDNCGPVFMCKGSFVKGISRGLYQGCSYYNQGNGDYISVVQIITRVGCNCKGEFSREGFERSQIKSYGLSCLTIASLKEGFKHSLKPIQHDGCQGGFGSLVIDWEIRGIEERVLS